MIRIRSAYFNIFNNTKIRLKFAREIIGHSDFCFKSNVDVLHIAKCTYKTVNTFVRHFNRKHNDIMVYTHSVTHEILRRSNKRHVLKAFCHEQNSSTKQMSTLSVQ